MNIRQSLLSVMALLSLAAPAQTITGKYTVPEMPEWARNAVFYQIYP